MNQTKYKTILFVCTGNSCRSAMAKGLMEDMLVKRADELHQKCPGLTVIVRSAGVATAPGFPASSGAIEAMNEEGIDITFHITQPFTQEMADTADLILVMEEYHRQEVLRRVPVAADKTVLLRLYGLSAEEIENVNNYDISDPVGQSVEIYKDSLNLLKECLNRVFDKFILGDC